MKNSVLAGFHAVGARLRTAPETIAVVYADPSRRDKRMRDMREKLLAAGAVSVKTCCILNKPSRRQTEITADYVGFDIPDEFVVGYGLDYAGKYRNLPYIGILDRSVYEK